MSIAFSLLLITVAAAPVLIAFDGLVAQSIVGSLAAITLAFVASSVRTAEVNLAFQATRRIELAAAALAVLIIVQLLPMPITSLSHSIWINADEALNWRAFGHISIDLGKTIEALIFYAANIATIIAAIFILKDRRRAELALQVLAAVAGLTTVILIILKFVPIMDFAAKEATEILGAVSSLGIILSIASATGAVERATNRRGEPDKKRSTDAALTAAGIEALFCLAGLAFGATLNIGLVVALGVTAFCLIQIIRRAVPAGWSSIILIATLIIAASMIIFWRYNADGSLSPFLRFATAASAESISMAQRMLSDTGWMGTGGGTYVALLPIYQNLGGLVTSPPSTASAVAIELGKPAACFVLVLCAGIIVVLYRGALNRGRDSCYSAAAAACAIVLLGDSFCDASLLSATVAVLGSIVIGLGLAQSISSGDRSLRPDSA